MAAPPPQQDWRAFRMNNPDKQICDTIVADINLVNDVQDEQIRHDGRRTHQMRQRAANWRQNGPTGIASAIWDDFERNRAYNRVWFALLRQDPYVPIINISNVHNNNPRTNPNAPRPFLPGLPRPYADRLLIHARPLTTISTPRFPSKQRMRDIERLQRIPLPNNIVQSPFLDQAQVQKLTVGDIQLLELLPHQIAWLGRVRRSQYTKLVRNRRHHFEAHWLRGNRLAVPMQAPPDAWPNDPDKYPGYQNLAAFATDKALSSQIPGQDHWVGQRIVGRGGQGIAGLWKNERVEPPVPRKHGQVNVTTAHPEYVVVKQVLDPASDLVDESDRMHDMRRSQHIIQLAAYGRALPIAAAAPATGRENRIIMEFLNGGSVQELIERQRRVNYNVYVYVYLYGSPSPSLG